MVIHFRKMCDETLRLWISMALTIELLTCQRGEAVEVNESNEMAVDVVEEEIRMLIQYQLRLLSHFGETSKRSSDKWPSTVHNQLLLVLLEVN